MSDELKPLPVPPNVPEWIEPYFKHLRDRTMNYMRAAVYEHLWREEAERFMREVPYNKMTDESWIEWKIRDDNADLCAARCMELSK